MLEYFEGHRIAAMNIGLFASLTCKKDFEINRVAENKSQKMKGPGQTIEHC